MGAHRPHVDIAIKLTPPTFRNDFSFQPGAMPGFSPHISAGGVNEKDAINGYYEQHSLPPSRPDSDRGSRGVGGNALSLGTVKAFAARS